MARSFKVLSPTAILGYGFPEESFRKAMAESPDLIAVDAGSSDPGPHYLGAGKPFTDRAGVKRDLRYMITAGVQNNIPVVIGTAGGSGAAPHLEWCREIIHEIAQEEHLSFSMALIPADVDKAQAGGQLFLEAPGRPHHFLAGVGSVFRSHGAGHGAGGALIAFFQAFAARFHQLPRKGGIRLENILCHCSLPPTCP